MNKLAAYILALGCATVSAQSIGNSPYAFYGLGDVKYDNALNNAAMGGIGTAYIADFSNEFNFKNPATNQNLDLTSLRVSATNENNYFRSNYQQLRSKKHSTYLSNLSLAFPISKDLKVGASFQPYSSKSYQVTTKRSIDGTADTETNVYQGTGAINSLALAAGYNITPEWAVGLRTNYYFGNMVDSQTHSVVLANELSPMYSNRFANEHNIRCLAMTIGASYQKKLPNDYKYTLGATYSGNLAQNSSLVERNLALTPALEPANVTEDRRSEAKNAIPTSFSLGAGYGRDLKWFAGLDYDYKSSTNFNNLQAIGASHRFSAGGWWLPNANNFRNYLSRVTYRGGMYFESGGLKINDVNVNQYALTLGANFPFEKNSFNRISQLDVALEAGRRGTYILGLTEQSFVNLKIGINFSDKWFMKRTYD
jgi:hypothetical protein